MLSNKTKNLRSFASASSWFEVYAAFSTFIMLLRTAFNDLIPRQIRSFLVSKLEAFFNSQPNNQISLHINEFWRNGRDENELFFAAQEYLPTRITRTYKSLKVGKLENEKHLNLAVDSSEEVVDEFEGTKFTWKLDENSEENSRHSQKQAFVLSFNEGNRERVLDRYIPHILKTHEAMKSEKRILEIYSWSPYYEWTERELSHPATFDTLALDPELKQAVVDDLERFLKRKEFYKKVGKPWKRGYLLYGPPGTGKSSLIAAIANYLKFDVYDLDLSYIDSDSDLMEAMRDVSGSSILVIEDIDCNKEVHVRSKAEQDSESGEVSGKFRLSNLLNFTDGLRSGGGEGWLIIFTTNHKEKIDPALLRPGRMDMHIHLSFLSGKAFPVMASNYLGIEGDHPLVEEIQGMLEKTQVTPAVVAEHLIRNEDPDLALEALVEFLKQH